MLSKIKAFLGGDPIVEEHTEPMAAGPLGNQFPGFTQVNHDGEKYDGGLGPVPLVLTDYWSLRARSAAFFKTNLYGRGIIRRFVTNVINTGLSLEADPIVGLLKLSEEQASDWAIDVEDKYLTYISLPKVCDWSKTSTFGEIERNAYREALVEGDVLIIEHHNSDTQLPSYELISGAVVQSPFTFENLAKSHTIEHGVELNSRREHVAYWVIQEDLKSKRIPAHGRKGRKLAWLYYATDKRANEVRGEPLLSLIMQSVGEIDKYRDATQRKATVNAMLAMFFFQSADSKAPNSRPVSGGANRRVTGGTQARDGTEYKQNIVSNTPGLSYEFLPPGVEPKGFTADGTDEKFGEFENAILSGISWGLEMPRSVVKMAFSNSYSASRGEIKEFNMTLGVIRTRHADSFRRPAYRSWLIAMTLTRRVEAPGLLEAWRDPMKFDIFGAWANSNWFGAVKEAVDLPKEVSGLAMMAENGYTTNSAAARQLTNTRFSTNIRRVQRENEMKAAAMRPILELKDEFGEEAVATAQQVTLSLVANSGGPIDG